MPRILVVDDEEILRELTTVYLEDAGYEVVVARDGREALRILENEAVDAIITDIVMPDMEGLELIRTLRRDYPGTGIIACSGGGAALGPGNYLEMAETMGAAHSFPKPIDYPALLDALAELLTS
jgi:CheY-like chemotaxis protein